MLRRHPHYGAAASNPNSDALVQKILNEISDRLRSRQTQTRFRIAKRLKSLDIYLKIYVTESFVDSPFDNPVKVAEMSSRAQGKL